MTRNVPNPNRKFAHRMIAGVIVVFLISTLNNIYGTVANPVQASDLRDAVLEATQEIDMAITSKPSFEPILTRISGDADTVCSHKDEELEHGTISGSPGIGPVYHMLSSSCDRLRHTANAVSDIVIANTEKIENLSEIKRELSALPYDDTLELQPKRSKYRDLVSEARELVSLTDQTALLRTLDLNINELAAAAQDMRQGAERLSRGQQDALERYEAMFSRAQTSLGTVMEAMSDESNASLNLRSLRNLTQAIVKYAPFQIPSLALAIGLDAVAFLLISLLALGRIAVNRERERVRRLKVKIADHAAGGI